MLSAIKDNSGAVVTSYVWGSDGVKRTCRNGASSGFQYSGSLTYSISGSAKTLESVDFGEGRIVKGSNGFAVNYHITDHLGSVRCLVNPAGAVVAGSQNDYYPLGDRYSLANNQNPYRYQHNVKERLKDETQDSFHIMEKTQKGSGNEWK